MYVLQLIIYYLFVDLVGRFEVVSEDFIPRAEASSELEVVSIVSCAIKCRQRRSFSFALLPPTNTHLRCLLYDDDVTVRPMMTSEGSIYVASIMTVKMLVSREL